MSSSATLRAITVLLIVLVTVSPCHRVALSLAQGEERKAPVDPGAAPDVQDVVFLGKSRPVLLRTHLFFDGQPFAQTWDRYLEKIFQLADHDGNGSLDSTEVKRLPSRAMMRGMVRGGLSPTSANLLNLAQVNADNNGQVSFAEVRSYYATQAQVSALMLVSGDSAGRAFANQITPATFNVLGGKDNKIELARLTRPLADDRVTRLDSDDDETLSPGELLLGQPPEANQHRGSSVGGVVLGGQPATGVGESAFLLLPKETGRMRLDERLKVAQDLIKRYDKDRSGKLTRQEIGFDAAEFKNLDRDGDGVLSAIEITRYFVFAPDVELTARLSKSGDKPAIEPTPGAQPTLAAQVTQASLDTLVLSLNTLQMELRAGGGSTPRFGPNPVQLKAYYLQQFDVADTRKKGVIDLRADMMSPQLQSLRPLFEMCDRNGDDKLSRQELEDGLQLFLGATNAVFNLTVDETGKGLFELLDTNRDGRLSLRELRQAKDVLTRYDLNADGYLSEDEIPVQLSVAINPANQFISGRQGYNPYQRAPAPMGGPLWFRKMDRNHDGDVSRREFLGTPEQFQKIDRDGDGLISRDEAVQASAAK